jgi:hypothetical protein
MVYPLSVVLVSCSSVLEVTQSPTHRVPRRRFRATFAMKQSQDITIRDGASVRSVFCVPTPGILVGNLLQVRMYTKALLPW